MRTYLHILYIVLSCVQLCVTPWTVVRQAPIHGDSPEYWSGLPCRPPGDLPNPGIKPRSHALQVDSLPAEPSEKLKNTGVDSLSLLQGIFELNWGLLHYPWILYQLSYQEILEYIIQRMIYTILTNTEF